MLLNKKMKIKAKTNDERKFEKKKKEIMKWIVKEKK